METSVSADPVKHKTWIELSKKVAENIPEIDGVEILPSETYFLFDAGEHLAVPLSNQIGEEFNDLTSQYVNVSGTSFARIRDIDGHADTKEIRATNPFN